MQVHGAELAQNATLLYVGMLAAVEQAARSLHGLLMCCASQCPPEPAPLLHSHQLTRELRWVPTASLVGVLLASGPLHTCSKGIGARQGSSHPGQEQSPCPTHANALRRMLTNVSGRPALPVPGVCRPHVWPILIYASFVIGRLSCERCTAQTEQCLRY